jgi:hypothetical protein
MLSGMSNYKILSENTLVHNGRTTQLTIHYELDGVQSSAVFQYPDSLENPEDPKARLEKLLAQGKRPTNPIAYDAQGGSWA